MVWTAPRTWVTAEVVSASDMNTHVRDNFLETAPGIATAASGAIMSTGVNTIQQLLSDSVSVSTSETTASTSYTDLATAGPAVTLTTDTKVMVSVSCNLSNGTLGGISHMGYAITGATSVAAGDVNALSFESDPANQVIRSSTVRMKEGLTAGSNTFTSKYRVSAGTGTFAGRLISVWPV